MTGEHLAWMKLSRKLNKSLSETKSSVTVGEFSDWLFLMDGEWNERTKLDWYLAHICYYLYLLQFILGGSPTKKPDDFLLKFDEAQPKDKVEDPSAIAERSKMFKTGLLASFGFNSDGTRKDGVKVKTRTPPQKKPGGIDGRGAGGRKDGGGRDAVRPGGRAGGNPPR